MAAGRRGIPPEVLTTSGRVGSDLNSKTVGMTDGHSQCIGSIFGHLHGARGRHQDSDHLTHLLFLCGAITHYCTLHRSRRVFVDRQPRTACSEQDHSSGMRELYETFAIHSRKRRLDCDDHRRSARNHFAELHKDTMQPIRELLATLSAYGALLHQCEFAADVIDDPEAGSNRAGVYSEDAHELKQL